MESKIVEDLKKCYGINVNDITDVKGGWLNQKWKISTNKGILLVKQFSKERYNKDKLKQTEQALQREMILEKNGVPCPHIFPYKNNAIRIIDDETAYMVMEFCSGKIENYNTINDNQIISLGKVCGQMHKEFSKLSVNDVKGYPISGNQIIDLLWKNFYNSIENFSENDFEEYKEIVLSQESILKTLTAEFFDNFPKGIAHEDFTPDNMLFNKNEVSAIIDFDRNQYSFIWHDIGRIMLSFTLINEKLDTKKIELFLKGYCQHSNLTLNDIINALKISWCIETPWWINTITFANKNPKIIRFKNEIIWLTKHWFELESLI